jgi:hypothetical protein
MVLMGVLITELEIAHTIIMEILGIQSGTQHMDQMVLVAQGLVILCIVTKNNSLTLQENPRLLPPKRGIPEGFLQDV